MAVVAAVYLISAQAQPLYFEKRIQGIGVDFYLQLHPVNVYIGTCTA
jgi:hypothetical protein